MKKILYVLLSIVLTLTLFAGCGSHQKELNERQDKMIGELKGNSGEMKEVTSGTFFNTLAGVAPGSKLFYILNKDKKIHREQSLVIEMNIDKSNKETEITNFVDKTIKSLDYLDEGLISMSYSNLVFLMYVDGKFTGNSISYVIKDDKLENKDTLIDEEYSDAFNKATSNSKSTK
ncbi:hypothetical protein [Clostridium sporogenes]|uniref:hypothetical protein n=1 Tax=Clostridium sporogenes TaxID=1509 RepID=UPI00223888CA|nr:hypothetical protein [Clostridium sporogenes]MCW6110347.1 hypothetical protein [Clostridium sporogenes]